MIETKRFFLTKTIFLFAECDILLKDWSKMKDEFIIREVVTKGKHIDFCLKFLTKKRKGNAEETKKYFWEQVSSFI